MKLSGKTLLTQMINEDEEKREKEGRGALSLNTKTAQDVKTYRENPYKSDALNEYYQQTLRLLEDTKSKNKYSTGADTYRDAMELTNKYAQTVRESYALNKGTASKNYIEIAKLSNMDAVQDMLYKYKYDGMDANHLRDEMNRLGMKTKGQSYGLDAVTQAKNKGWSSLAPAQREALTELFYSDENLGLDMYAWREMDDNQARMALGSLTDEQLAAIGQIGQGMGSGKTGYFADNDASREQKYVLDRWHSTLEGARDWAEAAQDTEDEEAAKKNLWLMERKAWYDEIPTSANFERDSAPQADFSSGRRDIDVKYRVINGVGGAEIDQEAEPYALLKLMNDRERATWNTLANSGKYADADDYLNYLEYDLSQRANTNAAMAMQELASSGIGGEIAASALSIPASLARGVGFLDALGQRARNLTGEYRPINYERGALPAVMADTARETVQQQHDWDVNVFGRDVDAFDFIYGTAMSGADSAAAALTGGWAGAAVLGTGAAQDAMQDAVEKGASDGQALMMGTVAGAFETLFEHWSISKLYDEAKHLGTGKFKDAIKNVFAQAGINFSEEFNTELANVIAEDAILGEKSEARQNLAKYQRLGMSEEDAKKQVAKDVAFRVGEAGMGGALMGAGFGAISNVSSNAIGKRYEESLGSSISPAVKTSLKGLAESLGGDAAKIAQEYDPARAVNRDTGKLFRAIAEQLPAGLKDRASAAMEMDLRKGLGEEAAGAVMAAVKGEELSPAQTQALAGSKQAMDTLYELMGVDRQRIQQMDQKPERKNAQVKSAAEESGTIRQRESREATAAPEATNTELEGLKKLPALFGEATEEAEQPARRADVTAVMDDEGLRKTAAEAAYSGQKTEQNGQKTEQAAPRKRAPVVAVMDDAEGGLLAIRSDGTREAAEDAGLSQEQLEIARGVAALPVEVQRKITAEYHAGQDPERFTRGMKRVYEAAARGESAQSIGSLYGNELSQEQRRAAIGAGQAQRLKTMQADKAATERSAAAAGFEALNEQNARQTGVVYANVKNEASEDAKTQLRLIDKFAREHGLQVRVYDTLGDENGRYTAGSNVISVALDADEGALTRTVSHEGYHYISQYGSEQAEKLKSYVLDTLGQAAGYDLEDRIRDTQERYHDAMGQSITRDQAIEEIVADSMLDVIGTEENMKALAKEDKSLFQRIGEWIKDTAAKLRGMIERLAGKSPEVAALKDNMDYIERVRTMYQEAMASIRQNSAAANDQLFEGARADADVQQYLNDMQDATGEEDTQANREALAAGLFLRAEQKWIEAHPEEYEAGLERFKASLQAYARGGISLFKALEDQGLDKSPTEMNSALAYAGRQLANAGNNAEIAGTREEIAASPNEEAQRSLRNDLEERREKAALESVRDDAELYAQIHGDEDARAALMLLNQLHRVATTGDAPLITKGSFEKRLSGIVKRIEEKTGTQYGHRKLMGNLRTIYQAMEAGDYNTGEVLQYTRDLMRQVLDAAPGVLVEQDESTKEALRILKERAFYLSDDQKSEIRYTFGALGDYMRKNFGKLKIRNKGAATASLYDVWVEDLHPLLPGTFAEDVSENDMPAVLDAFLENANAKKYEGEFGRNIGAYSTNMALDAMLDFYDVPGSLQQSAEVRENISEEYRKQYESDRLRVEAIQEAARARIEQSRQQFEERYRERIEKSQARKAETARKQTLRNKISRDVKAINTLNVKANDTNHVPEDMRAAALEAVRPFIEGSGVFDGAATVRLAHEYELLRERAGEIGGFDADTLERINSLGDRLNGRRLSELTEEELEDISDIVGNLHKMIVDANAAFIAGRKVSVDQMSGELKYDMHQKKEANRNPVVSFIRKYSLKETTPIYFGDRVGGVIKRFVGSLMGGQNTWADITDKAKDFLGEDNRKTQSGTLGKYHVNEWINDPNHLRFVSQHGDQLEMDRRLALSLYALWKRERSNKLQNANHLRIGGFMYDKKTRYEGVNVLAPHPLTENDMARIRSWLTEEQMAFADEMVRYLSQDLSRLGNEVSMRLYGYEKFKEPYYFPYSTDSRFRVQELTREGEQVKQPKSAGFSKSVMQNAANPIQVGDFINTWAEHVNDMAIYAGFAETVDTINRVLNDRIAGEIRVDAQTGEEFVTSPESNWIEMERAIGAEGVNYLRTLVKDVCGGVRADDRGPMAKGLSRFKKASVAGNLSVVVQQPTAIARAINMINPRYLLSSNPAKIGDNVREMYEHSGVAKIKRMGKFDTGTGKGAVAWITDGVEEPRLMQRAADIIDEVTGKGAEKADEWTWGLLWGAVKKEVDAERTELKKGTQEYWDAVTERFEDICNHTQVYDSVLSRSEWMRSQSTADKMATSFMSEPTLTLNMLQQALLNVRKPNGKKMLARAAAAFALNTIINAAAKSLVTAARKREEDKTYLEKYLGAFAANLSDDLGFPGIAGMVPWVRDVVSIFQGYTVERSDMDAAEMVYKAWKTLTNDNKSAEDKLQAGLGAVANVFGVPVKNLWRDIEGIIRTVAEEPDRPSSLTNIKYGMLDESLLSTVGIWDNSKKGYYTRIAGAMEAGQDERADELWGYITSAGGATESAAKTGVKSAIKTGVIAGDIDAGRAEQVLEDRLGVKEGQGFWTVREWQGGDDYTKYSDFLSAVETGKNLRDTIKLYTDHGVSASTLKSQITEKYKPIYRDMYKKDKNQALTLKSHIVNAFEALGDKRDDANKKVQKWLED